MTLQFQLNQTLVIERKKKKSNTHPSKNELFIPKLFYEQYIHDHNWEY